MRRAATILFVGVLLPSCTPEVGPSPDDPPRRLALEGGPPVCPDGPRVPRVWVEPEIATTGLNPNVIRQLGDGTFAITESASNTVSRWDFSELVPLADVGSSRNPYDVAGFAGEAWITNFLSNTVSVVDYEAGESTELTHPSLDDPSGVTSFGNSIVVTNVAYESPTAPYGDGTFTVFDARTRDVIATVDAAAKNPIFVREFEAGSDSGYLVATSSGELVLSDEGASVASPGGVEIWRGDPADPDRSIFPMPQVSDPKVGAPGRPLLAPSGDFYFASGTAPVLFSLDPEGGWIHGSDDPLRFGASDGDSLHHADMTLEGVILVTSFNEDGLYLWDTTCDRVMNEQPIDLGVTTLLEGPHGIMVMEEDAQKTEALFIMNLSNVLGRVFLEWE